MRRRGTAVLTSPGNKGGGAPVRLGPAFAGIRCGDIREEEDVTAKHRFLGRRRRNLNPLFYVIGRRRQLHMQQSEG